MVNQRPREHVQHAVLKCSESEKTKTDSEVKLNRIESYCLDPVSLSSITQDKQLLSNNLLKSDCLQLLKLPKFLDILAENYGAGLRPLDFIKAPEQSRTTINDWVSEQTEGKIKDLIPQGLIHSLTRLVLTNAIYFNAAWQYPFEESMTKDGPFYLLDGSKVTVPMMRQTENFGYTDGEGYQAVELPYDGRELSMVILLPRKDNFKQFEGSLDYQLVNPLIKALEYQRVNLTMPKFEFESEFGLSDTLAAMGMPVAFSASADFSGMTGNRELFIQEVVHKTFVSVDEAGTEAAAATAVVMPDGYATRGAY